MVTKFGTGIDLDDILGELIGQGQSHQGKKRYFYGLLIWVNRYQTLAYGVTSCDAMTTRYIVAGRHDATEWRQKDSSQQVAGVAATL